MIYFTGFFAFALVVGFSLLSEKIKSAALRQRIVTATLVLFLLMSIGRSAFNLAGGSLFDLVTGVKTEAVELYTVEQLSDYTCRNWQAK